MSRLIAVGRISKPYGLEGQVVLNLYDTFPAGINLKEPLFVMIDKLAVPLFFETFTRRGQSGAVALFSDIDTETRAASLAGQELLLRADPEDQTGDDDQLYLEDLVGYKAILSPSLTGRIADFIDSEMNPLFQIEAAGQEYLIPPADEFIVSIDTKKQTVVFSLPEGLLDL